ncbi:DUF938 domain-containing protein [Brevundimonas sp.]|uniref:DUF938 domain-containing protein n=1 Tax=Brevundimonas sp. TaxID=1871086 RepID=UPI002ABC5712|nr:DUF938 domain-containing protein [Brevundimonas sp.]MDZ4363361.1 DUF938 domain-containing protein [Brevundimonas sp.]
MDATDRLDAGALSSPAAERNAQAILGILRAHLPARGPVLEIASGTGLHAATFAAALPGVEWMPSDPDAEARASLRAWKARTGLPNLAEPLALDVERAETWPQGPLNAIVCINMIHISPWSATEGLMAGAGRVLGNPGGLLVLYGPYREADIETAVSNENFDGALKARDPSWGLRDRDAVVAEARAHGLHLTLRIAMPANNIIMLFRRA